MALIRRGLVKIDYLARLGAKDTYKAKFEALCAAIDKAPAVEAEPVRHAWWKAANRRGTLCDTYICSECGNMVMQAEGYTYSCTCNYCPGCGAKMGEI